MSRREIPEPWLAAMEAKGLGSYNRLGKATGVGVETVRQLILGGRDSSDDTMQAVAKALGLPVKRVREWAAAAVGEEEPFVLPGEANRLTRRQRDAVLSVVRAMLDPAEGSGATVTPIGKPPTGSQPAQQARKKVAARRPKITGQRDDGRSDGGGP